MQTLRTGEIGPSEKRAIGMYSTVNVIKKTETLEKKIFSMQIYYTKNNFNNPIFIHTYVRTLVEGSPSPLLKSPGQHQRAFLLICYFQNSLKQPWWVRRVGLGKGQNSLQGDFWHSQLFHDDPLGDLGPTELDSGPLAPESKCLFTAGMSNKYWRKWQKLLSLNIDFWQWNTIKAW